MAFDRQRAMHTQPPYHVQHDSGKGETCLPLLQIFRSRQKKAFSHRSGKVGPTKDFWGRGAKSNFAIPSSNKVNWLLTAYEVILTGEG